MALDPPIRLDRSPEPRKVCFAGLILHAARPERLTSFYVGLGFRLSASAGSPMAVLKAGPLELRIVPDLARGSGWSPGSLPPAPPGGVRPASCKLMLDVACLDEAVAATIAAGGRLEDSGLRWACPGFLAQDVVDPEGNSVQLRQREH